MDRRESATDGEGGNEGYAPPDEALNPPGEGGQANDEVIYAQGNFPTIYEYDETMPSASSAVAGLCDFGLISNMYADSDDDDDPAILYPEGESRQEDPSSGATYSNEGESNPPTTSAMVLEECKRTLPKSEGRMAAYVKKLRRERDRILNSINEQTAVLRSLYEALDNPPAPSNFTWFDHFRTYNVDQSLGVDNKLRYFSLMSGDSIYFVQGAGDRIRYASGYTFDGVSLSRNPDLPSTSDYPRRRIDFSEGGFTVGRSASVDSLPALIDADVCSIAEIDSGRGQRITEVDYSDTIISPIEDDPGSNGDSSHINQLESESGNISNLDLNTNEHLRSPSNQDSSNSNQIQSSTTNQDSKASTHDYVIPGPSSSNVCLTGADNPSSEDQSFASNSQSNVNTVQSLDPRPSSSNQNRDQEVSRNYSNTGNVGTDRIAVSQSVGAALVASPQVPIAMHSNQSFYNPTTGSFNAAASTGQNTVSSNSATNYSSSRTSSAVVTTTTGGYVPVPNEFYARGESAAFSANVHGQSFTQPGYYSPGGNYITNYGYSGGPGSSNATIYTYPAPVSRTVNAHERVPGFASMNVVTQANASSGVYFDNTQSFQANNSSQQYANIPPVYYPLAAPVLYNMQSYASGSSNEPPHGPGPVYGNTVVLSIPPAAFNFIPQGIQSIPGNMIFNPTTAPVQYFMGMNTPQGVMYIFAPGGAPYPAGNIIPYASGGMYNTVNVTNSMMPLYNPNSWHNSLRFDARYNSANLPPGNYAYDVQGNPPQLIDPSQELDQEESTQPTASEEIDDGGSARTRGFIKAIPQTSNPQSDHPNDSIAEACTSDGGSLHTSVSEEGKTKKSTHKRTYESSPLRGSSTSQSSPQEGTVTEVMNFPEFASGEQFSEVITSAEGSLRETDMNANIATYDRKKNRGKYSEHPHFGIRTRSKTRELLNRKEPEKSNLSERTIDADGAAASPSSAAGVDGGNFTSRTRRRSSRPRRRKRKQSARDENRDLPEELNLPEASAETRTGDNDALAALETVISAAELEAASSGPSGGGASRAAPADTRISEAVVEGTLGITGTALSVALSSRNRRKTIGPIKNRSSEPQSVNEDSQVASQPSSSILSNQSEIVMSETSELATGVSSGASADGNIKDETTTEGSSDTLSTSWNFIGMRSKKGDRSTKRKVSEKSYHGISRSNNQADFSEATAEGGDLQSADGIKDETGDLSGEPEVSMPMLEAMPSTSSGKTATGAIPKKSSSGKTKVKPEPLVITETDTTSKIFKTLSTNDVKESDTPSTSIIRSRLTIPQVIIHRPSTPESQPGTSGSQPGTSGSQPGTSDLQQRSSREITQERIQEVERILTRQRNNYNSILSMLRVIDDTIIEACLLEEDQESP